MDPKRWPPSHWWPSESRSTISRRSTYVARVIEAEEVPKAKKLVKLTLGLGGDERRTVFAGIKMLYEPAQLVGRLWSWSSPTWNRRPNDFRSQRGNGGTPPALGGTEIFLLSPDSGAKPGHRVHKPRPAQLPARAVRKRRFAQR